MRTLYLECNMGAAGDMLMAALYELLPDKAKFLSTMNGLGLPNVSVHALPANTCGIAGTHISVTVSGEKEHSDDHHEHSDHTHSGHTHIPHHHATPLHIGSLIEQLPLSNGVKTNAKAVYDAIAEAEAKAHGCPVGEVHFHEVGALDAVADVVGVCLALSILNPTQVICSPIHVGSGFVRCAHGVVSVPAPATVHLLFDIPCYGGEVLGELCTPTGAALLRQIATHFGPMPTMTIQCAGYGIGSKAFERANCVRAFLGETSLDNVGDMTELVCNLDDMTPEALGYATARLLELGALDVYTTPCTMKKGRAGWILTVLCHPSQEREMMVHILRETTTNGVRARHCTKYFLSPRVESHNGLLYKMAVGYGVVHQKLEFESAAQLARETATPISEILGRGR